MIREMMNDDNDKCEQSQVLSHYAESILMMMIFDVVVYSLIYWNWHGNWFRNRNLYMFFNGNRYRLFHGVRNTFFYWKRYRLFNWNVNGLNDWYSYWLWYFNMYWIRLWYWNCNWFWNWNW